MGTQETVHRHTQIFQWPATIQPTFTFSLSLPSADKESMRLSYLDRMKAVGKVNVLNHALDPHEMLELQELTREKYKSMPCMQAAIKRLNLALDESFPPNESADLKKLSNHVIGYYLNTNQYHNAFHAISMTLEAINLFNILKVKDTAVLKAIVIAALYHDTGNGIAPVAPDSPTGDEVEATKIYKQDLKEVKRRKAAGQDLGPFAALADLEERSLKYPIPPGPNQPFTLGQCSLAEVGLACITYTVFKDRFTEAEQHPLASPYIGVILKNFFETNKLEADQQNNFARLAKSYFVWLLKNADIAGSLEGIHTIQNSLLSYAEDQRRVGFKPGEDQNFYEYRDGFLSMLLGTFAPANASMAKVAREECLLPFPILTEEQHKNFYSAEGLQNLKRFVKERAEEEEKLYFERAKYGYGKIITALFVIAAEESDTDRNIATMPLKELIERLKVWQDADLAKVKTVLPKANLDNLGKDVRSLDFDLEDHPLLTMEKFQNLSIADLSPAMFNQIFLPNIAEVRTKEEASKEAALVSANVIFVRTNPRDFGLLEEHIGTLDKQQKKLICEHQKLELARSDSEERVLLKAWTKLRQAFTYHQIIMLAEADVIDRRIMGSSEEATCIQQNLQRIVREESGDFDRPCLSGILNLASHCPRSLRMLTLQPGEELITKGDKHGCVFVVLEGELKVQFDDRSVSVKPGNITGEMSVLTGMPAIASVYCGEQPTQVAVIREEDVSNQYSDDMGLRVNLIELARKRRGLPSNDIKFVN